jgi:cobalt-zinc-cadmium efflux system membrane fusion protein
MPEFLTILACKVCLMSYEHYDNPLIGRYASSEMSRLWGPQRKVSTWRRLWVALAEAEAELRRTQAAVAAARVSDDGRHIAITSLIAGRITKAEARLGAYVTAGTELFRVADPRRIQIEAAVTAADARHIRTGDSAAIELPGGETVAARVRSATPSLDVESRAATILLLPIAPATPLTPGQSVRVRITPREASPAAGVVVPEAAVQSIAGRDSLFIRTRDGFQARPVTIGARGAGRVEIVGGLDAGTEIATTGAFLLKAELGKDEAEH